MRLFAPFIKYREQQMAGMRRMTNIFLVLIGHSVEKHAMFHLNIYHSSSLSVLLVTSLGSLWAETWSFCLSSTVQFVTGSVRLSKCLSHLTEMEQQMEFCSDCTKCSCLEFDEDAINFGFYFNSAEKSASSTWNRWWHRVLISHWNHMQFGQESCSEIH